MVGESFSSPRGFIIILVLNQNVPYHPESYSLIQAKSGIAIIVGLNEDAFHTLLLQRLFHLALVNFT
jgi:hypothetical protein